MMINNQSLMITLPLQQPAWPSVWGQGVPRPLLVWLVWLVWHINSPTTATWTGSTCTAQCLRIGSTRASTGMTGLTGMTYKLSLYSNLNGQYLHGPVSEDREYQGLYWYDFHGPSYSLAGSTMMIRRVGGHLKTQEDHGSKLHKLWENRWL